MTRVYAKGTTVPISRSQSAITDLVESIGADEIVHGRSGDKYVFAFKLGARSYRYEVDAAPGDERETRQEVERV